VSRSPLLQGAMARGKIGRTEALTLPPLTLRACPGPRASTEGAAESACRYTQPASVCGGPNRARRSPERRWLMQRALCLPARSVRLPPKPADLQCRPLPHPAPPQPPASSPWASPAARCWPRSPCAPQRRMPSTAPSAPSPRRSRCAAGQCLDKRRA